MTIAFDLGRKATNKTKQNIAYTRSKCLMENHNLIKLASKYCRGLGDYCKRKGVFNYLRDKIVGIYCLQDTHFRPLSQLDTPVNL